MQIKPIHESWGVMIHGSYDEIMTMDLQSMAYQSDMLLFRGLGQITEQQYYSLLLKFGKPWPKEKYKYSTEYAWPIQYNGSEVCITKFSNKTATRLGGDSMPWHVDIPNHGEYSFPWRILYMVNNPNPESGITDFMSIRLDTIKPTEEELEYYSNIKVLNQSWYRAGEELALNDLIKTHSITNVKSLRLNYFVNKFQDLSKMAWIKKTFLNDQEVDNLEVIGGILKSLSNRKELVYSHQWQNYDLIIYDNWNLIHRRSNCMLHEGEERLFWRANVQHIV